MWFLPDPFPLRPPYPSTLVTVFAMGEQALWRSLLRMARRGDMDRPCDRGRAGVLGCWVARSIVTIVREISARAQSFPSNRQDRRAWPRGDAVWSTGKGIACCDPRKSKPPDKLSSRRSDKRVGTYLSQIACRALPSWVASEPLSGPVDPGCGILVHK